MFLHQRDLVSVWIETLVGFFMSVYFFMFLAERVLKNWEINPGLVITLWRTHSLRWRTALKHQLSLTIFVKPSKQWCGLKWNETIEIKCKVSYQPGTHLYQCHSHVSDLFYFILFFSVQTWKDFCTEACQHLTIVLQYLVFQNNCCVYI